MLTYKSVLCAAPFSSLFISKTTAKTCCALSYDSDSEIDVGDNINTIFNSANQDIRENFKQIGFNLENIHHGCVNCNARTDLLQRIHYNEFTDNNIDYITNPTLTYLHIDFSNICNLACRICNSKSSNLLIDESNLLENNREHTLRKIIIFDSPLYKSILDNLSQIRYLRFSGGEPLLHEEVWTLIETAYKLGYTKNIDFKVNTNGTIKLSKERIEILKSFKGTHLDISMDGIEKYAEYIRTNVVWDRWLANLLEYQKEFKSCSNIDFSIVCTISVYNVHIYDRIKKFFNNLDIAVNTNMLFGPEELCSYNINQRAKDYLNELYKDTYPEILHFVNFENRIYPVEIANYIDRKDNIVIANNLYKNYRAFRDVDPEWYAMLKG